MTSSQRRYVIPVTVACIAIVGIITFILLHPIQQSDIAEVIPPTTTEVGSGFKNATYNIEGKPVTLVNGVAESEIAPGSASKLITKYFGNEVTHDLDGDGRPDTVFLLTQTGGGSGTFYYAVAALNTASGYKGSQGFLLGDRIAPQTTQMSSNPAQKNVVVINYADRKAGESFAVQPSVGKSVWLLLDPSTMKFGEVAQNFGGEANPSSMSLGMKDWTWIHTLYSDGTTVTPNKTSAFVIKFSANGRFSATTDCNSISGTYSTSGKNITFGDMTSTLMYCPSSQETQFNKMLSESQSYLFTSKGELVLTLKMDSGSFVFK
ncbi:MAG: META domain-containing protein [Candidatus Paceibacterota bacterium]